MTDEALAWVARWIAWETHERAQRGLQRRLRTARIGRFKPLADFDWDWPTQCDKTTIAALMHLDFVAEAVNVILVGPNGVGKSLIAQNLAHQAVIQGHSAVFVNAAQMLGDLAAQFLFFPLLDGHLEEIEVLYDSIRLLPFELALRSLTDHLEGDRYFKVERHGQNLRRALTQFRLAALIEDQEEQIRGLAKDPGPA